MAIIAVHGEPEENPTPIGNNTDSGSKIGIQCRILLPCI